MHWFMWDLEQGSIFMEIWTISFPCQDLKAKKTEKNNVAVLEMKAVALKRQAGLHYSGE